MVFYNIRARFADVWCFIAACWCSIQRYSAFTERPGFKDCDSKHSLCNSLEQETEILQCLTDQTNQSDQSQSEFPFHKDSSIFKSYVLLFVDLLIMIYTVYMIYSALLYSSVPILSEWFLAVVLEKLVGKTLMSLTAAFLFVWSVILTTFTLTQQNKLCLNEQHEHLKRLYSPSLCYQPA